jgi:hypothetical protein
MEPPCEWVFVVWLAATQMRQGKSLLKAVNLHIIIARE